MADEKLTQQAELTAPADGDIMYIVDDPDGAALSRKVTRANLLKDIATTTSQATSYEINWLAADLFEITLTGNVTFTFANLVAGASVTLVLIQDGTGSRTVTWPASVDWPSATAPTLSTGANDVDVITLFARADGTTVYGFLAGQDMG